MKAIRIHEYGVIDSISLEEVAQPVAKEDEILVRVKAAGVNPIDWRVCDGTLKDWIPINLPFIPGCDFAGVVEQIGAGVHGFRPGDNVFGVPSTLGGYCYGAFAQFIAVKAADVAIMPKVLDMTAAAAVPIAALTAWQALFDRGELRAGQRVLIHAGAGGVGGFAIQFARHAGARVVTTCSSANAEYVRDLGAEEVIDYNAGPFEAAVQDLDLVLDLIGGEMQRRSYKVLRRGGVLVNALGALMQDQADAAGVRAVKVAVVPNGAQLAEIAKLIDAGAVRNTVSKVLPLSELGQAFAMSRSGHVRGKIVLAVPD